MGSLDLLTRHLLLTSLSGKTSLLKAIGGMLQQESFPKGYSEDKFLTGRVLYNNLVVSGEGVDEKYRTLFKNLVAFVRQNDAREYSIVDIE